MHTITVVKDNVASVRPGDAPIRIKRFEDVNSRLARPYDDARTVGDVSPVKWPVWCARGRFVSTGRKNEASHRHVALRTTARADSDRKRVIAVPVGEIGRPGADIHEAVIRQCGQVTQNFFARSAIKCVTRAWARLHPGWCEREASIRCTGDLKTQPRIAILCPDSSDRLLLVDNNAREAARSSVPRDHQTDCASADDAKLSPTLDSKKALWSGCGHLGCASLGKAGHAIAEGALVAGIPVHPPTVGAQIPCQVHYRAQHARWCRCSQMSSLLQRPCVQTVPDELAAKACQHRMLAVRAS
eukprot:5077212-Prymnesium_polylepis.3